ncbi:hypothetical protein ACTXT7_003548 [Hymenolepis weldensis]
MDSIEFQSTSLVNTAVLSGYPIRRPVWVYGLTHGNEVRDVTSTSTCHTSDDSVAHFPKDSCSAGLVFSGGELGGADTLSLVAKVDRTSADESITVWYPQEPQGVTLVVESPRGGPTAIPFAPTESLTSGYSASSILLRALADHGILKVPSTTLPGSHFGHTLTTVVSIQRKKIKNPIPINLWARNQKHIINLCQENADSKILKKKQSSADEIEIVIDITEVMSFIVKRPHSSPQLSEIRTSHPKYEEQHLPYSHSDCCFIANRPHIGVLFVLMVKSSDVPAIKLHPLIVHNQLLRDRPIRSRHLRPRIFNKPD